MPAVCIIVAQLKFSFSDLYYSDDAISYPKYKYIVGYNIKYKYIVGYNIKSLQDHTKRCINVTTTSDHNKLCKKFWTVYGILELL